MLLLVMNTLNMVYEKRPSEVLRTLCCDPRNEAYLERQCITEVFPFMFHLSNISHQYEEISQLKKNILQNEVLVHVDFSENYNCKYSKEIQSAHFGGSKHQVTIHTCVLYCHTDVAKTPFSYGTVSSCNRHDPAAIVAHLPPVIEDRFSESAHGKGAPDRVGAALKSTADGLVAHQVDIPDCNVLVPLLQQHCKGITVKQVQEPVITSIEKYIPKNIPVFKGTMKIHEVVFKKGSQSLQVRRHSHISCEAGPCHH
ncbi:hypothetical protein PR048_029074 [Dryococelus australis]|uniref:Uncharacterized protein n=1 Tax=Dryococelus australis TaxID=614101 RepID=A0ABQ9GCR1_9NEOP|nr:hypothetical protein PR048_029074 [Dryococelus australis]